MRMGMGRRGGRRNKQKQEGNRKLNRIIKKGKCKDKNKKRKKRKRKKGKGKGKKENYKKKKNQIIK